MALAMKVSAWEDSVEELDNDDKRSPGCHNGGIRSASHDKDVEALVARFRESDFLKFITQYTQSAQKEAREAAGKELARLHSELAQARARSKDSSEIMKISSSLPEPLHEKLEPGSWLGNGRAKLAQGAATHVPEPSDSEASSAASPREAPPREPRKPMFLKRMSTKDHLEGRRSTISGWQDEFVKRMTVLKGDSSKDFFMPHGGCFADVDDMKEQVRKAIENSKFRVSDYYHKTGCCQAIARTNLFECVTLFVITVNAFWIAIETDANAGKDPADVDAIFQVADHFFCVYFVLEWAIRFGAFRKKMDGLKDNWFIIDSILMLIMVCDTWLMLIVLSAASTSTRARARSSDTSVVKILRMTRILRMARMAHLLRAVPELTILVKGMVVAARSVFFTLFLLAIFIYIFAVAFRQVTDGLPIGDQYFSSVPQSMWSLLLEGTLPDIAVFVERISEQHVLLGVLTLLYILLGSLTVMNMLVGVLVEVVSVVSAVEKEELKVNYVKNRLQQMLSESGLDENHDQLISRKEFEDLLVLPEAARAIQDVGVDPVGLVDFAEFIFEDVMEGLSFTDFIEVVLKFRGSNTCTVRDAVDLRKVMLKEMNNIQQELKAQTQQLWLVLDSLAQQVTQGNRTSKSNWRIMSRTREESLSLRRLSDASEFQDDPSESPDPPSLKAPELPTGSPPPMSKMVKWAA